MKLNYYRETDSLYIEGDNKNQSHDISMTKKKSKRKLTPAEKREKKRRRKEYKTIFIKGKFKLSKI